MAELRNAFNPRAPHFYKDPSWSAGDAFCSERRVERISQGLQSETDVTRVLAFFVGEFGDNLARIFLNLAGVDQPGTDFESWVGSEWLSAAGVRIPGRQRSPDIIVTAREEIRNVLLIIEVKGNAWVNGGWGYCPVHGGLQGYSNQIICYAGNCWSTADLAVVPRLIIGPDSHKSLFGGWGRKGIVKEDIARYGLSEAFEAQRSAIEKWQFAGLRTLEARIKDLSPSDARRDALYVLSPWLDRIGV
ncbi:hypothetical protein KACC15558_32530 [Brevibacterium ammoniilyticum]|uniref:Uncharacterized protein n=1 Tax=Brevibacterium ammoniilyticum TaxID=1046555 RepID=A0ABP9U3P1_9MICO